MTKLICRESRYIIRYRKNVIPEKRQQLLELQASLDAPPEDSATTRGVDDTADTADGTGDVDQGVDPESDNESEGPPDMISEGYSNSEIDSDRKDENEHNGTIAEDVEDTAIDEVEDTAVDAPDADS